VKRWLEFMPLASLKVAKNNPKAHDVGLISESIKRFGIGEGLLLDERTGRLVAGHGRLEALRQLHQAKAALPVGIKLQGKAWLVPVQRGWSSKNDREAEGYLLASNQTTIAGGWNQDALSEMLGGLAQANALAGTGWDADDVERLIEKSKPELDEVPEPSKKPWVKLGQRFRLGRHTLVCGDSTDAGSWSSLGEKRGECCWTDPPYGVDYKGSAGKRRSGIKNDKPADLPALLSGVFKVLMEKLQPGSPVYIAHPANPVLASVFLQQVADSGLLAKQTLIWVKSTLVLSGSDYHYRHEPILYCFTPGERRGRRSSGWHGDDAQNSVFEVDRPSKNVEHPTMKPVELVVAMVRNSAARGGLVLEPFGGSGTTLVACESIERSCYAVELDPRFAQVIIERWEKLTGEKHRRLT